MLNNETTTEVKEKNIYSVLIPYVQDDEGSFSTYVSATDHQSAALNAADEMAGEEFETQADRQTWVLDRAAAAISVTLLKDDVLQGLGVLFGSLLFPDGVQRSLSFDALRDVIYENRAKLLDSVKKECSPEKVLSYHSADDGFCRIYYEDQHKRLFCFQLSSRNQFELLYCESSGEPSHVVTHSNVKLGRLPNADESSLSASFSIWWANQ
ncbi:hypothetical protein [Pseudomonas lactis]|uniref:hypothetical protein n=1 Tax=Pseudomonas lactis TaxID=1615674 RepID=UPI003F813EA5